MYREFRWMDLRKIVIWYEAERNGSELRAIAGFGTIGVGTTDYTTSISRLQII
jgi:hypothetical protein